MAEDGFSFPGIPDPLGCSMCSPPLWPVSPPPAPTLPDRSSSCGSDEEVLGETLDREGGGLCGEEEEKMDMLWEDFNEELSRSRRHPDVLSPWSSMSRTSCRKTAEFGCVKARTLSRTNGALMSARRTTPPGMVVLIKVLKKLFLHHHSHNTHGPLKKPCPW